MDKDLIVLFGGILLTTVGWNLSRGWLKRAELKAASREELAEIGRRLEAIERAIDVVAVEMERVSEAQRFAAKLQAGQAAPGGRVGSGGALPPQ